MRSDEEINRAIELYSDTIRRICLVHLKNHNDVDDIFQTVFLKYALNSTSFKDNEHEKAWFIRVTINACKDVLKSFFYKKTVPLDEIMDQTYTIKDDDKYVLEVVLSMPEKYRKVTYLYYYEGYTAPEIGKILNKNVNTIYTILNRSKKILKDNLGGDYYKT